MDHYPTWVFLHWSAVIGVTADAGFKSFQEEGGVWEPVKKDGHAEVVQSTSSRGLVLVDCSDCHGTSSVMSSKVEVP